MRSDAVIPNMLLFAQCVNSVLKCKKPSITGEARRMVSVEMGK